MLRILHGTKIDFIRWWRVAAVATAVFVLAGLIPLAIFGVNYSIEFTGGTVMQVRFAQAPGDARLRDVLRSGGIEGAEPARFGSETEYVIKAQDRGSVESQLAGAEGVARRMEDALRAEFGNDGFAVLQTQAIGPRVGAELRRGAIYAVLMSFVITLIYLAWRFEWRFGLAAVLATAHDILATLAFIKLLNLEVSLTVIAGILTVIGYSLNDTIIIFDRVRENMRKARRESLYDILNRSVNETLPRSVLTHFTTLIATLTLLIFAGGVIRPFAWVMTFGIFTGTFSSIYVASPLLLWIERKFPRPDVAARAGATSPAAPPVRSKRSTGTPTAVR
jgi:preprotein translocase subunit SecF